MACVASTRGRRGRGRRDRRRGDDRDRRPGGDRGATYAAVALRAFRSHHRARQVRLVFGADRAGACRNRVAGLAGAATHVATCARRARRAARFLVPRDRSAGLGLHRRQAPGRPRPFVEGSADPFIYRPLGWSVEYASLPSGHAVDSFAAAMAIGVLWPRMRPLMWTYAVVIAVSRVVLTAHFPSDVLVGAIVGVVGALLVRDWYAARGLGFVVGADGTVRPMPGPSLTRIKRVARALIAP